MFIGRDLLYMTLRTVPTFYRMPRNEQSREDAFNTSWERLSFASLYSIIAAPLATFQKID